MRSVYVGTSRMMMLKRYCQAGAGERRMYDLKMKCLAVSVLSFIRSKEEMHATCRRLKQLTCRRATLRGM